MEGKGSELLIGIGSVAIDTEICIVTNRDRYRQRHRDLDIDMQTDKDAGVEIAIWNLVPQVKPGGGSWGLRMRGVVHWSEII